MPNRRELHGQLNSAGASWGKGIWNVVPLLTKDGGSLVDMRFVPIRRELPGQLHSAGASWSRQNTTVFT